MIDVIMSVYNENVSLLKDSVESILNQTLKEIHFVIVIDNPFLGEREKEYLIKTKEQDRRIQLLWNKENIGLAKSLNKCLEHTIGDYIARMDADDVSSLDRLEKELAYLQKTESDMVSTNIIFINEEGNELKKWISITDFRSEQIVYNNVIVHPSVLIKTDVIRKLKGYRDFYRSQDYDLWLRVLSSGYKICFLNEYLLKYRVRNNALSYNNRLDQFYISMYEVELYHERIKLGYDSFSEKNLMNFLEKNHVTENNNQRFTKANKCVNELRQCNKMNIFMVVYLAFKAFYIFPKVYYIILRPHIFCCYYNFFKK